MFKKNKKVNSGISKIDKIVTGVIIGGAVASIFGLSKTKKGQEVKQKFYKKIFPILFKGTKKGVFIFGKSLSFFVGIFNKK